MKKQEDSGKGVALARISDAPREFPSGYSRDTGTVYRVLGTTATMLLLLLLQ